MHHPLGVLCERSDNFVEWFPFDVQ